jgi:probable rRNA maturation factor
MCSASFNRRLREYPDILIEIGSPNGATCSRKILSPGTHPISISFRNISLLSNSLMIASCPGFKSDNFILIDDYKAKFTELHLLTNSEIMATAKKTKVHFFSHDIPTRLKNVTRLRQFIESIFKKEKQNIESINYIFCTDKVILEINKKYLNHDFYTDVITFDLSSNNKAISAEVYISIERIKENAKQLKLTIKSELHRVLFHAALHLCGYNDKKKKDKEIMRKMEDDLLVKYFNP